MSNREFAKQLIDQISDAKLLYVIPYLQGAAIPEVMPNAETISSIEELESSGGTLFTGSTEDLFSVLTEE